MNRLTKDLNTPHDDTTYSDVVKDAIDRENIVLTKLKHYEELEEEIGIDLEIICKGIIAIKKRSIIVNGKSQIVNKLIYWEDDLMINGYVTFEKLIDYGKKWKVPGEE